MSNEYVYTARFKYDENYNFLLGGQGVDWEVRVYDSVLTGRAKNVRQAYRHAKRAVRRERRMWHFLNPPK